METARGAGGASISLTEGRPHAQMSTKVRWSGVVRWSCVLIFTSRGERKKRQRHFAGPIPWLLDCPFPFLGGYHMATQFRRRPPWREEGGGRRG
jgi:hypothetical protein